MSMTAIMGTIFALALWVLAAPPKVTTKSKPKGDPGNGNGISINIYQQGSRTPPRVVVRDGNSK
jgi:hypothetical protein